MLAQRMHHFRDQLARDGIVFCYSGYVTEAVLSGIGSALKNKLSTETGDKRTARGVFSLFVEQVQNVIRYSAEIETSPDGETGGQELRYGLLTVGRIGERYFVSCANMIQRQDIDRLRTSLERLKHLDADALKALYKETLRNEAPEGSKGAGAGFIDIARRASHGFEFDFLEINETRAYFAIRAFI